VRGGLRGEADAACGRVQPAVESAELPVGGREERQGQVRGTTKVLPRRLLEHCIGGKLNYEREKKGGTGGNALHLRPQAAEKTLKDGKTSPARVRVAAVVDTVYPTRSWTREESGASPVYEPRDVPEPAGRQTWTTDGETKVVTYVPLKCKHRHAEALHLARTVRQGASASEGQQER
jgi:hypothetical protein